MIYHYTTIEGLLGIVERHVLFATDVLYMNDSQEVEYPASVVSRVVAGIVSDESMYPDPNQRVCLNELADLPEFISQLHFRRPTCATCFCANGDLLSQWRAYGSSGGFAIGFDREALAEVAGGSLAAVEYDWLTQAARTSGIIKRTMESEVLVDVESAKRLAVDCSADVWFNALFYKDAAFSEESEWRLVATMVDPRRFLFRVSRMGLTPYLEEQLPSGPSSPIREVVIGPTAHPKQTERAVRLLLDKFDLNAVEVTASKVPLRL